MLSEGRQGVLPFTQGTGRRRFTDEQLRSIVEKTRAKIKIIGVGGAGCNTVTRMSEVGIIGARTIAVNTDAQDLVFSEADEKLLIGERTTGGLGAGNDPEKGKKAAEESKEDLKACLDETDMAFITCGLGGGTGTGASPVIAEICRRMGILSVAVVTLPFRAEGVRRRKNAELGLENLKKVADALVVIPNDKLRMNPSVSIAEAFKLCDSILVKAVKGIVELITYGGEVNVDFADVKAVLSNAGLCALAVAESDAENRAEDVVNQVLNDPLLDVEVSNAKGALLNLIASNVAVEELDMVLGKFQDLLSPDANLIWGLQSNPNMRNTLRLVTLIAGVYSPWAVPGKRIPPPSELDFGIKSL